MRTFLIRNGDIQLSGDRYAMVEGPARVQQQIGLCMRETYGIDRFHPGWGSVLPNWVGNLIANSGIENDLATEVRRVVQNFVVHTNNQVQNRANSGLAPVVKANEVVTGVSGITVRHQQDKIYVKVDISTASASEFSIITTPGAA